MTGIIGYRTLSADEVALINEVKAHAEKTRELLNKVDGHLMYQAPSQHHATTNPLRWLAEGRTDLQKGFMSVIRAIAQPTSF